MLKYKTLMFFIIMFTFKQVSLLNVVTSNDFQHFSLTNITERKL